MSKYRLRVGDIFEINSDLIIVQYKNWYSDSLQFHSATSHERYGSMTEGYILKHGNFLGNVEDLKKNGI